MSLSSLFSDLALFVIFLLNVATDVFKYVSQYIFGRQVEVTERQKQLLGVKDNGKIKDVKQQKQTNKTFS